MILVSIIFFGGIGYLWGTQVEPVGGLLGELGGVRVELLGFRIDALLVQVSL